MQKVVEFLEKNPEEELTRSDIATKFGVMASTVDGELKPAVASGRLVQSKDEDDALIWRIGGPKVTSPAPFAAAERAAKAAKRARRRAALAVDLKTIQVEKNVPLHEPERRMDLWNQLFRQMTDINDSFAVPADAHTALCHAAQAYRKEIAPDVRFTIRKINEDETRIWRVA